MKVIFIGPCHQQWQNTILMYLEAKHKGYDVHVFSSWAHDLEILESRIQELKPNWLFIVGSRSVSPQWIEKFKKYGMKICIWDPDSLSDDRRSSWFDLKGLPDLVICSHLNVLNEFSDVARKVVWMPQFYDSEYYKISVSKSCDFDVCFIGNSSGDLQRDKWLKELSERYKLFVGGICPPLSKYWIVGSSMANAYRRSKIAIDIPWGPFNYGDFDTSDRIFKAMGCGTMYLTYDIRKLALLFRKKYHLDTYVDWSDLIKKIDYYLSHDGEREAIARRGSKLVNKKHTLSVRIEEYWRLLESSIFDGV